MVLNDAGFFTWDGQVPSLHLILSLYYWFCMVCLVIGQALLHETVLSFRLDSRGSAHSRHSKLSYHPQYLSGINLVSILISVAILFCIKIECISFASSLLDFIAEHDFLVRS